MIQINNLRTHASQFLGASRKRLAKFVPHSVGFQPEDDPALREFPFHSSVYFMHAALTTISNHRLPDSFRDKESHPAAWLLNEMSHEGSAGYRRGGQYGPYISITTKNLRARQIFRASGIQLQPYADKRLRPLARRRFSIALPVGVALRLRKPCVRLRLRLLG